ncbi:chorismate-binding protein [Deinococcus ruber]|uniref:Aminodeoxychorismate components I/II n=1 Tax=Deinococcus ruber TaxID=1848197 RepID=A0A918C2E3_9DEIO|nr:chorismate-binding protein [Deinococcus ruber]GGR00536.1 aminodeoxychorismate components I/II [Deinococcus ruber]
MPGLLLLESLGPVLEHARYTLLSAAPTLRQHTLPQRPAGTDLFPAWLGGLKYEAAQAFGLPSHPAIGPAQTWGQYPSGLVWDRLAGTLSIVGTPHLNWEALLSGPAPAAPRLQVGAFSADDLDYVAGVQAVQELIRAGEVYQVNLSRGVMAHAQGEPLAAYLRLRADNPSPYMAYADFGTEVVVSCSPERLVRWDDHTVSARPIAGTRPRGATPDADEQLEHDLRTSVKEQAEHIMLTDLIRHDLGWLSQPGSVHVPDLMLVERYSHVMHLVSEVRGTPLPGLTTQAVLRATFPGGTITGAPKRRVMQAIRELEPSARGWYTGSLGIISGAHTELNILIRTATFSKQPGGWTVGVRAGAGIVIDSEAGAETRETVIKAQALLGVLSGEKIRSGQPPQPPRAGRAWSPPPVKPHAPLRVLLLDNFDSFTQNLAHDLAALGAVVLLRDHTAALPELLALHPDAVLIGPGPGTPQTSGVTLALTRACLERRIPLLGVCLGHQALGEALGGRVVRAARAIHGQPEALHHDGRGVFAGIPQGAEFTRYHSLVVQHSPGASITASTATGEIMALEATHAPAWGVQFHPESVLSTYGRLLLGNWLTLAQHAT